jgi:hypothetical protein
MSVRNAFERQHKILGSTSVFEMTRPNGWSGFGIVRARMPWFFTAFLPQSSKLTFLFLNQEETEAVIKEASPSEGISVIEEHKYFGHMLLLDELDTLACYYETLEGIGFVTVSTAWTTALASMRAEIEQATKFLDAELKAVEHCNERSRVYVARVRSFLRNG